MSQEKAAGTSISADTGDIKFNAPDVSDTVREEGDSDDTRFNAPDVYGTVREEGDSDDTRFNAPDVYGLFPRECTASLIYRIVLLIFTTDTNFVHCCFC